MFYGIVTNYDKENGYYCVQYEDNETEEYDANELAGLVPVFLVDSNSHDKKIRSSFNSVDENTIYTKFSQFLVDIVPRAGPENTCYSSETCSNSVGEKIAPNENKISDDSSDGYNNCINKTCDYQNTNTSSAIKSPVGSVVECNTTVSLDACRNYIDSKGDKIEAKEGNDCEFNDVRGGTTTVSNMHIVEGSDASQVDVVSDSSEGNSDKTNPGSDSECIRFHDVAKVTSDCENICCERKIIDAKINEGNETEYAATVDENPSKSSEDDVIETRECNKLTMNPFLKIEIRTENQDLDDARKGEMFQSLIKCFRGGANKRIRSKMSSVPTTQSILDLTIRSLDDTSHVTIWTVVQKVRAFVFSIVEASYVLNPTALVCAYFCRSLVI